MKKEEGLFKIFKDGMKNSFDVNGIVYINIKTDENKLFKTILPLSVESINVNIRSGNFNSANFEFNKKQATDLFGLEDIYDKLKINETVANYIKDFLIRNKARLLN